MSVKERKRGKIKCMSYHFIRNAMSQLRPRRDPNNVLVLSIFKNNYKLNFNLFFYPALLNCTAFIIVKC